AAGVLAISLFMDIAADTAWERTGPTPIRAAGPYKPRTPRPVPQTDDEADLYRCLTSDTWARHRRVEQERIPLDAASARPRGAHRARRRAGAPPVPCRPVGPVRHRVAGRRAGRGVAAGRRTECGVPIPGHALRAGRSVSECDPRQVCHEHVQGTPE